jgi:flagellar hook-associated protein 3 FlgL
MRISTQMIQQSGTQGILRGQSDLIRIQQQLSTGRSLLSAADNPIAAARAVGVQSALTRNSQYAENVDAARTQAAFGESTLGSVSDLLQEVRDLVVLSGNGALNEQDRAGIVVSLRGAYDRLIGLANTRDGAGNYIFGGYRDNIAPFQPTPTGATYSGDDGERTLQVSSSRAVAVTVSGAELFERIRTANGVFTTAPSPTNTGTGTIDRGTVADPTALTTNNYAVQFTVSGATTTYNVVNTTTGTTLSSNVPYAEGQPITFAGMQFSISGAPANGDSFTMGPSANQSVFKTMTDFISALQRPGQGAAAAAILANQTSAALANIDQALDNVVGKRAELGATLRELDNIDVANGDRDLQFQAELSDLRDVDYAKAITEFTSRQQALQAAQSSYMQISKQSLFDML